MQLAHNGIAFNYWENPGLFYITAIVEALFTKTEQLQYQETVLAFDQCFRFARENNMQEANAAYEKCSQLTSSLNTSLLDWLLAFYGQRLCYYHYKLKHFEEGIGLTQQINRSVERLQQKGYQFLFFVEIQQRLNLSRIYIAQNEMSKAISICTGCITEIYDRSNDFDSRQLINGVPESELTRIAQYEMIVEVLTDACNKILSRLKEYPDQLEKATVDLIEPLIKLDFNTLSGEPKYTCINKFISLLGGLTGYSEIEDNDILFFMNSPYADKKMLMVLNRYIALVDG